MCELALLEHISRKDEPDDEERRMVWEFLDDLIMKKGIVLGFFRKFTDLYPGMGFYAGNAFLEYRTEEDFHRKTEGNFWYKSPDNSSEVPPFHRLRSFRHAAAYSAASAYFLRTMESSSADFQLL